MPDGCIAALPAQSGQSCEGVIEALALKLEELSNVLAHVVWLHVYHERPTEEDLDECLYTAHVREADALLSDMERDWGHLTLWRERRDWDKLRGEQASLDLEDTPPRKQGQ